jgi:hypothetical protein
VAPSDMPHRRPDMSSKDMRLMTASGEAAGLAEAEPLSVDLCGPLGFCRLAAPATAVAYASLPLGELSCRLLWAASSLVAPWTSGSSSARGQCAGLRLAGSSVAPTLESSSAFLLHALGNPRAVVALSAARVVSAADARTFFFYDKLTHHHTQTLALHVHERPQHLDM